MIDSAIKILVLLGLYVGNFFLSYNVERFGFWGSILGTMLVSAGIFWIYKGPSLKNLGLYASKRTFILSV